MDNIAIIKDQIAVQKSAMVGELLNTIGETAAQEIVARYAEQAKETCRAVTDDAQTANTCSIEFVAECTRCCGEYWNDVLLAGFIAEHK